MRQEEEMTMKTMTMVTTHFQDICATLPPVLLTMETKEREDENSGCENVNEPQQNSAGSSGGGVDEAALWSKRGSDMAEAEFTEEEDSPKAWTQFLRYHGRVQMEGEEEERFEDVEEEEEQQAVREETVEHPASSSAGHDNPEVEAHGSISDMVAGTLIQQGRD